MEESLVETSVSVPVCDLCKDQKTRVVECDHENARLRIVVCKRFASSVNHPQQFIG